MKTPSSLTLSHRDPTARQRFSTLVAQATLALLTLTVAGCGAEPTQNPFGDQADLEAAYAAQSAITSSGSTLTPDWFPAVVDTNIGCVATKIASRKFLTAGHCAVHVREGQVFRFTNDPRGLSHSRSAKYWGYVGRVHHYGGSFNIQNLFEAESDIAVVELDSWADWRIPSMRFFEDNLSYPPPFADRWFSVVGYGYDHLHNHESGTKQMTPMYAVSESYFANNSNYSGSLAGAVFRWHIPGWSWGETGTEWGDGGSPAVVWVDNEGWKVIGVTSIKVGGEFDFMSRTSPARGWLRGIIQNTQVPR